MASNSFFEKGINYLNKKFIKKNIDNKYWKVVEEDGSEQITTLIREDHTKDLFKYYPDLDIEKEKKTNLPSLLYDFHKFTKYLYKIEDCIIEPEYNWVILGDKKIFKYSWPYYQDPWVMYKPTPSVAGFFLKKKPMVIEKAILAKYYWSNFYHFLVDILTQIRVCDEYGIPGDVPIIVPHDFEKYQYVQDYINHFNFKRKIIIQRKGQYINVKELYVGKDNFLSDSLVALREEITSSPVLAGVQTETPELVFLTRSTKYRRSINNTEEIENIAKECGFTVVDTGTYTLTQQVKLFSKTKCMIAIHGAGLGNLLFCKGTGMKLLEIFPGKNFNPPMYMLLSKKLGYGYMSVMGGGAAPGNGRFDLDPELFRTAVKELLQSK